MSIQTKDLIRYNNHITYYKKNHSDFIQKSHYNSTNRQQNPSIYFVRQPEIFSLFKAEEIARGEAFVVAKGHFPSSRSSPPATQITVGCGDVFRYWRGDGCCGIGYETLCRFIPILHNFFSGNHLLPSNHKETQPFLPAVQRSADGSSNLRETTQPHTLIQPPEQPPHTLRLETPAGKACAVWRRLCRRGADS